MATDTIMADADPSLLSPTSNVDVNMDEADAPTFGFVRRNPNVINLDSDDGNVSDDTLLGDEFVEKALPSASEARRSRRQVRDQFRELQTYPQNGRTIQVGGTFQDQNGTFFRVTSIRQHRRTGTITIGSSQNNHKTLQKHSYNGRTLKPSKTVEMADGDFLRIEAILKDRRTGAILLEGFRFRRARTLNGLVEFKPNEVVMILKFDKNDTRDIFKQSTEVVPLAAVVRIRELVKTNQQFPALSFRETDPGSIRSGVKYISDHCRLVCRWHYVKITKNEGFLRRVTDDESDDGCSIPQGQLRENYRGPTSKGGSCPSWLDAEEASRLWERTRCFFIDPLGFHSSPTDIPRRQRQQQTYTFGDGFCGGGGASRGASGAGFRVAWGFDHDSYAIANYCANFPRARCEGIAVNDFLTAINEQYQVEVLHLSPPCKPWSPAHTRLGPNDESNQAAFLATEGLLKKTRPRIVTLEETFGLTRIVDHLPWFNAMIQIFTKLGFSVRWKVFNLQEFGLPQPRRRLIIFASW